MEFVIALTLGSKEHLLPVKFLGVEGVFERYEVKGSKGTIILQNNRPLLKSGGMNHQPFWSLQGKPPFEMAQLVRQIGAAIDGWLNQNLKVFFITPILDEAKVTIEVSFAHTDKKFEYYRLKGHNIFLTIKNNRPILKSLGKENAKLHWSMQGISRYENFLEIVSKEMEKELNRF
jgi:hypothetical protein